MKNALFYIDDVIWVFRDLTREHPASMFDNPFMNMLKTAHDRYGMKVQLNVFYRTDFYYGNDEFSLADMTDAYKAEWEAASDWLKLGFHAKQEFPDYPYINATYDTVKSNLDAVKKEIFRFAGENTFAYAHVTHWLPMSRAGVQALYDGGIRLMTVSTGEKLNEDEYMDKLPYGHKGRLLQNRQPETGIFVRETLDESIHFSACGYNHCTPAVMKPHWHNFGVHKDEATGMCFKKFCTGPILNCCPYEQIESEFAPLLDSEYLGYALHEQYFYPDYYAYQSDYAEKIYRAAEIVSGAGFAYFFPQDIMEYNK
ncbi:MAG: hypothetical protein IJZ08_01155 [Clostridia bacterium]|nr:hypothetical protein [Clostridia bacterium]